MKVDGVALTEWARRVRSKSHETALKAILKVEDARFLVGAADIVVPALRAAKAGGARWHAIRVLGAYGPLATSAIVDLAPSGDEVPGLRAYDEEIALALIGEDPARHIERWRAYTLGLKSGLAVLNALAIGGRLRYRGDVVPAALLKVRSPLARSTIVKVAADLGPAASVLRAFAIDTLKDKRGRTPSGAGQAAKALAWMDALDEDTQALLVSATRIVPKAFIPGVVRGLAVVRRPPSKVLEEYLGAKVHDGDPLVASWAAAGLARMGSAETPVPQLVRALRHERHEVRAAAATGLLAACPGSTLALDALRGARDDVDTRVRWRAVAAQILAGDANADLLEIGRAIDGPCDEERLLVFETLCHLGRKVASLAGRLEPWTQLPFPRLAEPARQALAALLPQREGPRDA